MELVEIIADMQKELTLADSTPKGKITPSKLSLFINMLKSYKHRIDPPWESLPRPAPTVRVNMKVTGVKQTPETTVEFTGDIRDFADLSNVTVDVATLMDRHKSIHGAMVEEYMGHTRDPELPLGPE